MTTSHVVRVATWNILSGRRPDFSGVDLDGVADGVTALDADIVALQEVDRALPRTDVVAQLDTIAVRAGYTAVFVPALVGSPGKRWRSTEGDDGVGRAYGIGLLTRIPMLRWRRLRLPGGAARGRRRSWPWSVWDFEPRVAIQAEFDIGGQTLSVTATHLSYMPWRGARQLRALAPVAGRHPAVLLGDLNLPPRAVGALLPGWRTAGGAATYPVDEPRIQVDHIMGRGLAVGAAETRHFPVSDHLALVCDVTLDPTFAT